MDMPDIEFPPHFSEEVIENLKIPPHSIEAEQSVLGGLMLDNQAWIQIADKVSEEDFYRRDHQLIFRSIRSLLEEDKPCDVITLDEWLDKNGQVEAAGGLAYLATLAKNTPSAANIKSYADIVRDRSILRQLAHIGSEITNSAFETGGRKTSELLDIAEQSVFAIAEQSARQGGFTDIKTLLAGAVDRIDTLFHKDNAITGVATGFNDLDEMTSGFQPADLVIIAGRPSMGKTTLAMNIAEHVAVNEDLPVAVFSMEMPGEQLILRMMSSLGRIDQNRVRTGKLSDDDWPRLTSAISILSETKLFIDDSPALSPIEIRARSRRLVREHGEIGLIVLDYLQLMQIPGHNENRATEVAEISRSLKALAKELNVPIIALSQLNRALEQRPDKRPKMADLRESGGLEQDADVILFIYRDEVYDENSEDKGTAEIIIGKQRNGPIGTVRLAFLGQYTRFENFTQEYYSEGDM